MSTSKGNEPAFPRLEHVKHGNFSEARYVWETHGGLTKREYFAGLAMQGLLANPSVKWPGGRFSLSIGATVSDAANIADALIAELEKQK